MGHLEILIQSAKRSLFFREFDRARQLLLQALPYAQEQGAETFVQRAIGDASCGLQAFAEAEGWYRQALASRPEEIPTLSDDHASLLSNLGYALDKQDRFDESEPLHTEALAIRTKLHGKGHPALIQPLNNLAFGFLHRDDPRRAEACLAEALRIAETSFTTDHPALAEPLNNLGELRSRTGHLEDAAPLLRRALAVMEAVVPEPNHPDLLPFLANTAVVERQLGNDERADALEARVEKIRAGG